MKYFFILGNNPALSFLEIKTVFKTEGISSKNKEILFGQVLLIEAEKEIDVFSLQKRLGGTIKIGFILKEKTDLDLGFCQSFFKENYSGEGRFKFGFSFYGNGKKNFSKTALSFKKWLKEKDIGSRWVVSKEKILSSVVVEQNKLLKEGNGVEFVYIKDGSRNFIGKTQTVQDFKGLSERDYGRPSRDDHSGMLPPKLAQIMINLSGTKVDSVLLDPFCGSGTVLMESVLIGYKEIIGADISQKAIDDTKNNLSWFFKKNAYPDIVSEIYKSDAREISGFIEQERVDVIVTEPFLGPQRGLPDARKTIKDLEELYSESLKEFKKILKKNSTIVMVWPVLIRAGRKHFLKTALPDGYSFFKPDLKDSGADLGQFLNHRGNVVYGRDGQKVFRELVILKYN